jgi:pimeloyl-ACP methyl ester carboxylesterase
MKKLLTLLFSLLLLGSAAVKADIVVLVHGYLGSPNSWQNSRINHQLQAGGWQKAGIVFQTRSGAMLTKPPSPATDHEVYSVRLPSKAPAMLQAEMLHGMISDLEKRHPDEAITLIGHSAGGVVARLKLVRFGAGQVDKLITIAAPHLGTHMAIRALEETHESGPVGILKSFFGGDTYHTVKSSTGLLLDLVPARPGNLIYWLNSQPHPDIDYISIVRGQDVNLNGDRIIPGFSQDMNNVPVLRGKSQRYYLPTGHLLNKQDGKLLVRLLKNDF